MAFACYCASEDCAINGCQRARELSRQNWPWPAIRPVQATPQGCICPPTSEQTCRNPLCPRKNPAEAGR